MAVGLPALLVTALSALAPAAPVGSGGAIFSSALPLCDEVGLSAAEAQAVEEGEVEAAEPLSLLPQMPPALEAAARAAALPMPLTPASFARACAAPLTPEAALVCTDVRATLWVNRMSSGCSAAARPKPIAASLRAGRGGRGEGPACFGPECALSPLPDGVAPSTDDGRSLVLAASIVVPLPVAALLDLPLSHVRPPSPPARRLLRPPNA